MLPKKIVLLRVAMNLPLSNSNLELLGGHSAGRCWPCIDSRAEHPCDLVLRRKKAGEIEQFVEYRFQGKLV